MSTRGATLTPARPARPARRTRRNQPGVLGQKEVVAVVIERSDKTCAVVGRGNGSSWPSLRAAQDAVSVLSPDVVWRETTRGVWVARAG